MKSKQTIIKEFNIIQFFFSDVALISDFCLENNENINFFRL